MPHRRGVAQFLSLEFCRRAEVASWKMPERNPKMTKKVAKISLLAGSLKRANAARNGDLALVKCVPGGAAPALRTRSTRVIPSDLPLRIASKLSNVPALPEAAVDAC
jgi:hypothetical protein